MRRFRSLLAVLGLVLLLLSPMVTAGCSCGSDGVGVQSPFFSRPSAPKVVPTQWGIVQPVPDQVVSVPAPVGVTYRAQGVGACAPGGTGVETAPVGTVYTPGYGFQPPK